MLISATIIIALYLEPVGSILQEPWNFVDEIEVIDVGPSIEELERALQRKNKRILELEPGACTE